MRHRVLTGIALIVLCALTARADEWNKTYQVTGLPEIRVSTSDANVEVYSWDKDTVSLEVSTENIKIGNGMHDLKISERQEGNTIIVEVRDPNGLGIHFGWNHVREKVTVNVPRKSNINVHTGDGHISIQGVSGNLDTTSGDGAHQITDVSGNLRAQAGDGHIRVSGRFHQLELKTGDGAIEATVLPGSKIDTGWSLHTGDGHLALKLPAGLPANLDVHTSDGHIDIGAPLQVSGRIGGNTVRGTLNGGGGLITLHTGDGSISVQTSGADTI